jgi:hypothetical protein
MHRTPLIPLFVRLQVFLYQDFMLFFLGSSDGNGYNLSADGVGGSENPLDGLN